MENHSKPFAILRVATVVSMIMLSGCAVSTGNEDQLNDCGDGICLPTENADSCPGDCPAVCGDGFCTHGETGGTCPGDCTPVIPPAVENMVRIRYTHPDYGAVDYWIYTYEASRPDATDTAGGVVEDPGPQSIPGVVPWTMVTHGSAAQACAARGKRLCTETEWQAACQSRELRSWPYGFTYVTGYCNDDSYDLDPGTPADDDGLLPAGGLPGCVSYDGVYDMCGNAREWTATSVSSAPSWRIRGGGYASSSGSASCDSALDAGGDTDMQADLGFRCCMNP